MIPGKSGRVTSFGVGHDNDKIELVIWEDDGTRNLHLTIFYKDIPVGTVPLIDEWGLSRMVEGLKAMLEDIRTRK